MLSARDLRLFGLCAAATLIAGLTRYLPTGAVIPFLTAAVALALLATLVGHAVDALGDRLGAGATGVVQSALGNLPELFVCMFAGPPCSCSTCSSPPRSGGAELPTLPSCR